MTGQTTVAAALGSQRWLRRRGLLRPPVHSCTGTLTGIGEPPISKDAGPSRVQGGYNNSAWMDRMACMRTNQSINAK